MLLVLTSDEAKQVTYEIGLDKDFGCLAQCGIFHLLEIPISKSFLKANVPCID